MEKCRYFDFIFFLQNREKHKKGHKHKSVSEQKKKSGMRPEAMNKIGWLDPCSLMVREAIPNKF